MATRKATARWNGTLKEGNGVMKYGEVEGPFTFASRFEKGKGTNPEELLNHANNTVSAMVAPKENLPDPTDRASFEADRDFIFLIRGRESKLIKKIKNALERIENNTFGVCEKCDEDISIARLKARPVTTQCIDCKTKEEAVERALGI
ncbi:MAG TPA: TraR/DksA C4-type zinc finger protein [Desulfobacterales bacterium]|nr:TraR/DksA C4-type zinc finger protein [Desulfobacterales bacterium]